MKTRRKLTKEFKISVIREHENGKNAARYVENMVFIPQCYQNGKGNTKMIQKQRSVAMATIADFKQNYQNLNFL